MDLNQRERENQYDEVGLSSYLPSLVVLGAGSVDAVLEFVPGEHAILVLIELFHHVFTHAFHFFLAFDWIRFGRILVDLLCLRERERRER